MIYARSLSKVLCAAVSVPGYTGILGELHPSQDSKKDAQPPLGTTPQLKVLLLLLLNSGATGELGNPPLSQGSKAVPGKPPTD